jgi:hypothetical protein
VSAPRRGFWFPRIWANTFCRAFGLRAEVFLKPAGGDRSRPDLWLFDRFLNRPEDWGRESGVYPKKRGGREGGYGKVKGKSPSFSRRLPKPPRGLADCLFL